MKDLLSLIEKSPSSFHAVKNLEEMLLANGFMRLDEREKWELSYGKGFYAVRGGSSLIAFRMPKQPGKGFRITAVHSDSPCFKIKEQPEISVDEQYVKLNVEKYGGMLLYSWLDRPLSVAGRVVIEENGGLRSRLVDVDRDLLVIPSVAIHLNRDANKDMAFNPQTDLLPLFGGGACAGQFWKLVAESAGVKEEQILGSDLFLYCREKGRRIGAEEEFLFSPRLDDLQCAYSCMKGLTDAENRERTAVCAVLDHEEVGSGSRQGAASTFLKDTLLEIGAFLDGGERGFKRLLADSFLLSADNAHALHPNHQEKSDPTNKVYLNRGIVLKFQSGLKYTTDGGSAAFVRELCRRADVPLQTYYNRSDMEGGSTLGRISLSQVSVESADIGLPQLAMHSAVETAGVKDGEWLIKMLREYYQ